MTSAHRPTFDPVKGKAEQMRSAVTHARSLPSHTKMKYRRATRTEDLEGKNAEAKKNDNENDDENEDGMLSDSKFSSVEDGPNKEHKNSEDNDDGQPYSQEQVKQSNLGSSQIELNNSESSSEYESESEDEETLLRELEKIKQERKEKKMEEIETEMRTLPQKRSWRNSTFRNTNSKKTTTDKKSSYTNDTLKTDYHQKFMDKFIK
ncbi:hypothetical protein LJB42_000483 [Komagataella kurtzmanii]|nr:hypothetical protein LJB42_000483 [Komagataella kurtzmanii]